MIIIDGARSEKEIASFGNLEEALLDLMQDERLENRVVTDVLVNNEAFSEIYPHQAEDILCNSISSLELRTVPMDVMAADMAGEMDKVAAMMAKGAREVSRLFREAADVDALELFQDLLDVTRDFLSMLTELRQRCGQGGAQDQAKRIEQLSALLSEMSDVMENEDWVLLADLLEFEFLPMCEEWQTVSRRLHTDMAAAIPAQ
ncbi:hypothetical protein [Desulfovibrio legallii]|uniref:Uncharacterized protein n=1 Tax=Desulfovibrio legallii TaxID=571438 RepID=A0A1G7HTE5_9BACT|nr:hypothetical protein [Desulfovibrio legallii]SDF03534.1 hypothetical protein SAMN05192586_10121 [Desulfovibrio legallii]